MNPSLIAFAIMLSMADAIKVFRDAPLEEDAPGLKIQITKKGLDYANELAGSLIDKELMNVQFPEIVEFQGSTSLQAVGNKITTLDLPSYEYRLTDPDRLTWSLKYGSLAVGGSWFGKKKIGWGFFSKWIPGAGMYKATAQDYNLNIYAKLGVNEGGKPALIDVACSLNIRDFSVNLYGGLVSWFLDFFSGHIAKKLKPEVQAKICQLAKTFVQDYINNELSTFPTEIPLTDDFTLDYHLLNDPYRIHENTLETLHSGRLIVNGNATELILPPALTVSTESATDNKMIHIWASDFMLNALMLHAHEQEPPGTVFVISREALPSIGDSLNTECEETCLGKLFPEVANKFPNSRGKIRIAAEEAPTVIFSDDKAVFEAYGSVDLTVSDDGDNKTKLLSATFQVDANLNFFIEPPSLKVIATAQITRLQLEVAETILASFADGNLVKDLKELLIPPLEGIANEVLKKGIPIPITDKLELIEPSFKILNRTFELASDVKFTQ